MSHASSTFLQSARSSRHLPTLQFRNPLPYAETLAKVRNPRMLARLWHALGSARSPTGAACARYASLARSSTHSQLADSDLSAFQGILGDTGVITDQTALEAANEDWMGKYRGQSRLVLRPKTTEQVSAVLRHCNERKLAVVPQGGNSSLVGGSVPVFDEVILSLAGMNKIHTLDKVSGALSCQAGCTMQQMDDHAREHGFILPLDLGAKGSCQAGGFVSTNAGGLRFLRYGSLHGTVLGLETVLADGTVLSNMQTLPKDNTGYDLKQLFIGAEGTLGVVTGVVIHCPAESSAVHVSYLAVPSYDALCEVFRRARRRLGEILSAFEFLDRQALLLTKRNMEVTDPLPQTESPFNAIIETSGSSDEHDNAKLEGFLEEAMADGLVADGTIAQDSSQAKGIWHLRESISVALRHAGPVYKYDLSLPSAKLYEMVEVMRQRLSHHSEAEVVGYGHLGDNNLHLNISTPRWNPQLERDIEPFVYEWTSQHGGSISAEHGLGRMKANCMRYAKSPEMIATMRRVKNAFDPNHILNPYKVLPNEQAEQTGPLAG